MVLTRVAVVEKHSNEVNGMKSFEEANESLKNNPIEENMSKMHKMNLYGEYFLINCMKLRKNTVTVPSISC